MSPEELAVKVNQFCLDRLGLLAMELEANEQGAKDRIREAVASLDAVDAVLAQDKNPSLDMMIKAYRGTRLLQEDRETRAVFNGLQRFMSELADFMSEELKA